MNLNQFAKQITLKEGKKKSVNIAQVKEVLALVLNALSELSVLELSSLMQSRKKK